MRKCMELKNLDKAAQAAAERIAKRRGISPEKVAAESARIFSRKSAVYRVASI